jgi:hypothetical protein
MKRILNLLVMVLLAKIAVAQAPQGIPYQAVARNSSGAILASTAISVRFTIRDSIATGAIKYRETFAVTTTAQGMFSVNVGQGTPVTGTFAGINWGTNAKFMQVEIDPAGGSSYIDMGTQQMMSVPYSLNAGSLKLRVSTSGDTLYSGGGNYVIIPGISAANTPLTIGMSYGGGKIAYIFAPGDPGYVPGETHGLISATSDQSTSIEWYNGSFITIGATVTALGTGMSNTNAIVAAQGSGSYAAKLCADLVLNGYSDWYLPSIDELNKLYINRSSIGGFATGGYWSSSELNASDAWAIYFSDGSSSFYVKFLTFYVRAVRSF